MFFFLGNQEKWSPHDCLCPPLFIFKSLHTIKIRMFPKKYRLRIFNFWIIESNFVRSTFFCFEPYKFKKSHILLNFRNFYPMFRMWSLIIPINKLFLAIGGQICNNYWFLEGPLRPPHGSHQIWYALGGRVNLSSN